MRAFLKSLDELVWAITEIGWEHPNKALADWSKENINECNFNSKGLNAIFMVVSLEEFRRISK